MILESARRGSQVAKFSYKRIHQALSSILRNSDRTVIHYDDRIDQDPDAIKNIDPEIYTLLEEIEASSHNNEDYLVRASRLSQRRLLKPLFKSMAIEYIYRFGRIVDRLNADLSDQDLREAAINMFDTLLLAEGISISEVVRQSFIILGIILDDGLTGFLNSIIEIGGRHLGLGDSFLDFCLYESGGLTPLVIAALLGNSTAVKTLKSYGADSTYRVEGGLIGLHFLWMFDDEEVDNIGDLLSDGVASCQEYMHMNGPQATVPGQLLTLEGSPLQFAVRTGGSRAIGYLTHRFNMLEDMEARTMSFKMNINNIYSAKNMPSDANIRLKDIQDYHRSCGDYIYLLGCLLPPEFRDVEGPGTERLSDPPSTSTESPAGDFVIRHVLLILFSQNISNWVAHGPNYYSNLKSTVNITLTRYQPDPLKEPPDLSWIFIESWCRRFEPLNTAIVESPVASNIIEQVDHDPGRMSRLLAGRPSQNTLLGILPSRQYMLETRLVSFLGLAFFANDERAFRRLFRRGKLNFGHDWLPFRSRGFAYTLQFIIFGLEPKRSRDFIDFWLAEQCQGGYIEERAQNNDQEVRATRHYTGSVIGFAVICFNIPAAVALTNAGWDSPGVHGSGGNVLHFAAMHDSYAEFMTEILDQFDDTTLHRLLFEECPFAKFTPLMVSFVSGSRKCLRALLPVYERICKRWNLVQQFLTILPAAHTIDETHEIITKTKKLMKRWVELYEGRKSEEDHFDPNYPSHSKLVHALLLANFCSIQGCLANIYENSDMRNQVERQEAQQSQYL